MSSSEAPLVRVEHVSKKYCRSLRRSLWYGLRDLGSELTGRPGTGRLDLRKDEFLAVDDVSFELRRGECLGLIGANGAGKSTLLKMLNGLVRPDAGRIEIHGRVGALIELGAGFNPILSGRENVYVNGAVLGLTKKEIDARFDEIVDFAEVREFIDTPVQSYSSGMRVRLGFAIAAHLEPDVLLIDEVLAVGDASFATRCIARMATLAERTAIVFVSHHLSLVARVANRVLLLDHGHVTHTGSDASAGVEALLGTVAWPERETLAHGTLRLASMVMATSTASGERELEIDAGEAMTVRLALEASSAVPRCFVNVHLLDLEERGVFECDSRRSGLLLERLQGEILVELALPQLALNSGRYLLSLHVVELRQDGHPGEILLAERNLGRLRVRSPFRSFAPFQLVGDWSIAGRREA